MSVHPPRIGERILVWCLRSAPTAIYIVGDLRQEYATVRATRGALIANLWYWSEVTAIGARYIGRRRTLSPLRDFARDIRSAARVFRTAPGFAAAVVLTGCE